jgi:hypothetical protein
MDSFYNIFITQLWKADQKLKRHSGLSVAFFIILESKYKPFQLIAETVFVFLLCEFCVRSRVMMENGC